MMRMFGLLVALLLCGATFSDAAVVVRNKTIHRGFHGHHTTGFHGGVGFGGGSHVHLNVGLGGFYRPGIARTSFNVGLPFQGGFSQFQGYPAQSFGGFNGYQVNQSSTFRALPGDPCLNPVGDPVPPPIPVDPCAIDPAAGFRRLSIRARY